MGIIHARLSQQPQGIALAEEAARYAEGRHYLWLRAQALFLLADLYAGLNEYSRAIDYSKRALEISEQLQSPNDMLATSGQLAAEHTSLGDSELSLEWHQRSLNLAIRYPMDPSRRWPVYGAVSGTFSDLNLLLTAIACQKEALHLANEMNRPLQQSRSHNFLGEIYGKLNNYGEAMKHFERVLELSRSVPGDGDAQNMQAHSLLRLGHIHRKTENLAQALNYYDESARLYEQMNGASSIFNAHRGKLLVYLALRDDQSVQKELQIAEQLFEKDRAKIIEENLRNSFFDAGQDIYDLAIQFYAENPRRPEQAFDYSERSRARSLLDLMQTGTNDDGEHQADDPELLSAVAPSSLSKIRREMPPSVQIVQYALLSERLYIWVVSNSAFQNIASTIRLDELNSKVSGYLKSIKAGEPDVKEADRLARELYGILIKPVEPFLDAGSEICFVPDEILNYLPFGALIEPTSGKYLIEKYAITLSPSSAVFLECTKMARRKNQQSQEQCLSVGHPLFDQDRFPNLPDLPSTGREAERVAGYYTSSRQLLAGDARESAVRRELQSAEIIHLASHSLVNEQSPGHSGVVLAKESSDAEPHADGLLEAREISRLKLRRAKLVILSACQTWLGRGYRGEGMVGLARAFLAADVPLVVASLWAVNDETTGELMNSFHRHRTQDKLSTAQALRQAQLDMLRRSEANYRRPFAWAAFVTVGGHARY
jgi:CHAT domain-containing protein